MNFRFFRTVSGALVITCIAASSAAAVISTAPALGRAARPPTRSVGTAVPRNVRLAGSAKAIALTDPAGCSSNGPSSFVGVPGLGDFAGGDTAKDGFAGVVSGTTNRACDGWSFIGGGRNNTVGGDSNALHAVIAGGEFNGIESALDGFIGGGAGNLLTSTLAPANFPFYSAIVGGSNNSIASSYSFIGAGNANSLVATAPQLGGPSSFIGAGFANAVSGNFSSITAGQFNSVSADEASVLGGNNNSVIGADGVVAGGKSNTANALATVGGGSKNVAGFLSVVAGGFENAANNYSAVGGGFEDSASGPYTWVGGGSTNAASNKYAAIGGGIGNIAMGVGAAISGGSSNFANAEYASIAGGTTNQASGAGAAIGGGGHNTASATSATIPGGSRNVAGGTDSFAAGTASVAANSGTFVWSDDAASAKTLSSTAPNQFLARAAGGFYLYSAANLASGVRLAPGSGSWSMLSDRAAKTAIAPVDDARLLARVAALPVSEWSYATQGTEVRHVGPMAQDFRMAFGLGEDDRHIASVDEEGVALAAIKALYHELGEKSHELRELRRNDDEKYARLEKRLSALEEVLARSNLPR